MSSDNSDDENIDLLREATDFEFINDSMFANKSGESVIKVNKLSETQQFPSLRLSKDENEQFNLFHVTPEFQNYVARQLTKILDKYLEDKIQNIEYSEIPKRKKYRSGVRLFSDSRHFLEEDKSTFKHHHNSGKKFNRKQDSGQCISKNILKVVAVDPETILSKQETKYWSNRSKAQIFRYKTSSDGILVEVKAEFK
ncbi:uncharacterized protein LOC115876061 [Sitophilus oryzae]|uniref:Protein CUSTOS n=1 Tax=Sitophilus oryzae TaxID=7048 RepID=A0A6J2X8Q1_SITOR|nr:uncharacterized protein LOC115876061 [Sitophilus oryzae]